MFKKKNYFLFFLGILVPISLTLNVISSSFIFRKLFNNPSDPFSLRHLKNKLSPPKEYSDFHKKNLVKFDIEKIISIEDIDSANLARSKIINFLWGEEKGFPTNLPKIVEKDHYDESYADINELDQINKITIVQDFDINSIQYHFIPKNSNNRVVIYHQGHDGDFIRGKHIIKSLIP